MFKAINYQTDLGGSRIDPQPALPADPTTDYTAAQLNALMLAGSMTSNTAKSAYYFVNTTSGSITSKTLSYQEITPSTYAVATGVGALGFTVVSVTVYKNVIGLDGSSLLTINPTAVNAVILDAIPTTGQFMGYMAPWCWISNNTTTSFVLNFAVTSYSGTGGFAQNVLPVGICFEVL